MFEQYKYLHDAVPIVSSSYAKQSQERHAEVTEVSVLVETLARVSHRTFCRTHTARPSHHVV